MNRNQRQESFWGRASSILERSQMNAPIPQKIIIPVSVIKYGILVCITQSILEAIIITAKGGSGSEWFIPVITLLQCGWVWDRTIHFYEQIPVPAQPNFITNNHPSVASGNQPKQPTRVQPISHPLSTNFNLNSTTSDLGQSTTEDYHQLVERVGEILNADKPSGNDSEELQEIKRGPNNV